MTTEYPEFFARFYDLIYHSMRDGVDSKFFINEAAKTKGKVLEVGVGTGRLFKDSLDNKVDIFGIDISPNMIEVLKNKIPPGDHNRISLQNIIDFQFGFKFDLIIAPFRVFMHLADIEDQISALNNVYNHLNHGGKFIFDAFIPDLNQIISGLENVVDFEGEYETGKRVKRTVSTNPDLINQMINIRFRIDWDTDDGLKTGIWDTSLRFFFRYELEHLIERSKFENYFIHGDYEGNELGNNSREFLVTCKKYS